MCVVGCMGARICVVGYIQLDQEKGEQERLAQEERRKRKESRRSMREASSKRKGAGGRGRGGEYGRAPHLLLLLASMVPCVTLGVRVSGWVREWSRGRSVGEGEVQGEACVRASPWACPFGWRG